MPWVPSLISTSQLGLPWWFIEMQARIILTAAFMLMMSAACSQVPATSTDRPALSAEKKNRLKMSQSVPGSYIVKVAGEGEPSIKHLFAEYGVTSVHVMGNELYEFRLSRDPGIEILKNKVESSGGMIKSIQPNYIYHIN